MDADLPHGMNTLYQSGQSRPYAEFSSHAPQYGHSSQHGAHTLPPIQPQRPAFSQPQSQSYSAMGRPQQHPSHGMAYPGFPSTAVSQSPYAQSMNHYSQPPYSQAPSQMHIAHDYQPQSHLPNLRPMPPGSGAGAAPGYYTPHMPEQDFQPRHVVGSQGRRGILPPDEGRPAAPLATGNGSSAKNATIPPKDADGKYPCPHCQKTYLHAKHLKRHLLRHTGDRPYSCALCSDTFSRSDILKRHFQKCSIRRGNPGGVTHLQNSQSHLKKQQAKKAAATSVSETGFPTAPHTPTSVSFGDNGTGLGTSHISTGNNAQSLSSRSDHDRHLDEGRPGLAGPTLYNRPSTQSGHNSLPSSGSSTPLTARIPGQIPQTYTPDSSTHTRVNSFSQNYPTSTNPDRNDLSQMHGPPSLENGFDWTSLQQHKVNTQLPSPVHQDPPVRHETVQKIPYSSMESQNDYMSFLNRESDPHNDSLNWSMSDTYQKLANRLTFFCQSHGPHDSEHQLLRHCIAPENIEHFFQSYMHFDAHWPALHLSTFNPGEIYDGLLLAMICVGAVYSDRLSHGEVRNLLRETHALLERTTDIFKWLDEPVLETPAFSLRFDSILFYELAALHLVGAVSWWHGDHDMRENALRKLPMYCKFAGKMGWFAPLPAPVKGFSVLHQPGSLPEVIDWSWNDWLVQESRSRWAWIWWMADSALTLYANVPPSIDPTEVTLPLPADDAAWHASSAEDCASALGLNGAIAQVSNVTGSRRKKQPEMHLYVKTLLDPDLQLEGSSTNAFGKFILVHSLIVHIFKARRNLRSGKRSFDQNVSLCDWVRPISKGRHIANDSDDPTSLLLATEGALRKFKALWDRDIALQYPADVPRIGFCRDGIHFYWLARMLLRNNSMSDWQAPWHQRFRQIIGSLKQVKAWVTTDAASRGEDIGSVAAIDESYGMEDLTIDMKLLFAPLAKG